METLVFLFSFLGVEHDSTAIPSQVMTGCIVKLRGLDSIELNATWLMQYTIIYYYNMLYYTIILAMI